MKKVLIGLVLSFLCFAYLPLSAQENQEEEIFEEPVETIGWFVNISYIAVNDKSFASDASEVNGGIFFLNRLPIDFPELWESGSLSLGVMAGYKVNSGIMDNQSYAEQKQLWHAGLMSRLDFPESVLQLDINAGELASKYRLKSGYDEKAKNFFIAGQIAYRNYAGRLQGEAFLPTWSMVISGGLPWSDRVVFDYGFSELMHRFNESGNNISSIHGLAELGLVDIIFSESFLTGMTIRGLAGKYNENIKYFGLGGGLDIVTNNVPVISFKLDKVWGWQNNQFDNWLFSVNVSYGYLGQIW